MRLLGAMPSSARRGKFEIQYSAYDNMETRETVQSTVILDENSGADLTKNAFLPHRFIILQKYYYYYYHHHHHHHHHSMLVQILIFNNTS